MKIGVFGGTFNPIHNMHINIALEAKRQVHLDKVIFITAAIPPHKKNEGILSGEIRHKMVEIAIEGYNGFEASTMELDRVGKSYTYYTLVELKELYPNDELYFIVGGDSLAYLHEWYRADEFMKLCYFVVYPRDDDSGEQLRKECELLSKIYGSKCIVLDAELGKIASSQIRDELLNGENIASMVPARVLEYIKKHELYV